MSINIPGLFVDQFTTNVQHLLQIKGGKMRPYVTEASYTGKSGVAVDQIGKIEMTEVTSRFAPMPRMDFSTDRRWVFPIDFEANQMIDTFDKLRLIIDPQSYITQNAIMAAARRSDEFIMDAFYADAKTGVSGGTTEAFDTTNHRVDAAIGAAADTGLNVDKILRAKRLLRDNFVDLESESPIMVITPQQEEDLLRQTQVINTDYFTKGGLPVLASDGRIESFAGVRVLVHDLVPSNASYRLVPMWVPSGMHLGVWSDIKAEAGVREDLSGRPSQLYTTMTMGATRLEAGRVIQIECTE